MKKILVVDDTSAWLRMVKENLEAVFPGVEIITASSGSDAINALYTVLKVERGLFPVIISDVEMPHENGFDFAAGIRRYRPNEPITLMSMDGSYQELAEQNGYFFWSKASGDWQPLIDRVRSLL